MSMLNLADCLGAESYGRPYKAADITSTNKHISHLRVPSPFPLQKPHNMIVQEIEWANHFNLMSQPQEPHSQHRLLVLYYEGLP